jgi:hypothetical protein
MTSKERIIKRKGLKQKHEARQTFIRWPYVSLTEDRSGTAIRIAVVPLWALCSELNFCEFVSLD